MVSTDSNVHWAIGDVLVEDALQEKSNNDEAVVFMHLDTPHPPPERRAEPAYSRMLVIVPWNNAVILAEWLARDKPSPIPTEHDSISWINGDWRHADDAKVGIVAAYSPRLIGVGR